MHASKHSLTGYPFPKSNSLTATIITTFIVYQHIQPPQVADRIVPARQKTHRSNLSRSPPHPSTPSPAPPFGYHVHGTQIFHRRCGGGGGFVGTFQLTSRNACSSHEGGYRFEGEALRPVHGIGETRPPPMYHLVATYVHEGREGGASSAAGTLPDPMRRVKPICPV